MRITGEHRSEAPDTPWSSVIVGFGLRGATGHGVLSFSVLGQVRQGPSCSQGSRTTRSHNELRTHISSCPVDIPTGSNRHPTPNMSDSEPCLAATTARLQTSHQCTARPAASRSDPGANIIPSHLDWNNSLPSSLPASTLLVYSLYRSQEEPLKMQVKPHHSGVQNLQRLPTPAAGNVLTVTHKALQDLAPPWSLSASRPHLLPLSSILGCTSTDWLPYCLLPKPTRPQGLCTASLPWHGLPRHLPDGLSLLHGPDNSLNRPHSAPSPYQRLLALSLPGR